MCLHAAFIERFHRQFEAEVLGGIEIEAVMAGDGIQFEGPKDAAHARTRGRGDRGFGGEAGKHRHGR